MYKCTKCTQASSCQAANGNKRLMLSQALNHAYKRICILLMWRQKQHTCAFLRKQELNLALKAMARYLENKLQDNKKGISPVSTCKSLLLHIPLFFHLCMPLSHCYCHSTHEFKINMHHPRENSTKNVFKDRKVVSQPQCFMTFLPHM